MSNKYYKEIPTTVVGEYTTEVPFYIGMFVTEKTITSNDVISPLDSIDLEERFKPRPGYGAMYRFIGNGVNTPSFSPSFKKASTSGEYDKTLVTFLFDGKNFWYSIVQEA
jgi:hypothetical protein